MNQRWISFITVLAILSTLLCGFGMTASAEEVTLMAEVPEVNKITLVEEDFLFHLGIIRTRFPEDRESYMAKETTRGGMAQMMSRVAGLTPYTGDEMYFNDVPAGHTYAKEINAMAIAGILKGDGNGSFRPDDPITADEMATVCSIILGYKIVGDNETYPVVANRIGLYDGVEISGNLTIGQFYRMLLNTFDTEMMEQTTFGDETKFTVINGYTALERYHGLVKQRGIVNGVHGTRLSDVDINLGENHILIDGNAYYWDDTQGLLGKAVVYYSQRDKVQGGLKQQIEFLYVDPEQNSAITMKGEDVVGFEGRYFKFYNESKEKKVQMAGAPDVVANGVAFPEYKPEDLKPDCGNVTLLDNNKDGKYDVVFIEDYTFMMISSVDQENGVLHGKYPAGVSVGSKDQEEVYTVFMEDGIDGELGFLLPGDVVAVQSSKNKTGPLQITVTYLGEGTPGILEGVYKDTYTISGVPYQMTDATTLDDDDYVLGQNVSVYTHNGYLAAMIHAKNDNYKFGYLVDAKVNEKGFGGTLSVRIVNQQREMLELTAPKKFMLDESEFNDAKRALAHIQSAADKRIYAPNMQKAMDGNISANYSYFSDSSGNGGLSAMREGEANFPKAQPVRYRINDAGELTHLDTLIKGANETEYSLIPFQQDGGTEYAEIEAGWYNYYDRSFYESVNRNLVVTMLNFNNMIMPPYDRRDEVEWYGTGNLGSDIPYILEPYTVGKYRRARYILVYQLATKAIETESDFLVLGEVERVLDEDGMVVRQATIYSRSGATTYKISEEIPDSDLVVGNVVRITLDSDKQVVGMEVPYAITSGDPGESSRVVGKGYNYASGPRTQMIYGTLVDYSDELFTHTTSVADEMYNMKYLRNYVLSDAKIYRYSNRTGDAKIEMIGPSEVVTYEMDRESTQRAIMVTYSGQLRMIYIIDRV